LPTRGSPCTTNTPPRPPRAPSSTPIEHVAFAFPAEQLPPDKRTGGDIPPKHD